MLTVQQFTTGASSQKKDLIQESPKILLSLIAETLGTKAGLDACLTFRCSSGQAFQDLEGLSLSEDTITHVNDPSAKNHPHQPLPAALPELLDSQVLQPFCLLFSCQGSLKQIEQPLFMKQCLQA